MLKFQNQKWAATKKEFEDAAHAADGQCSGYYRFKKQAIIFMDAQKEPFACLVNNPGDSPFFVSCRRLDGKIHYFFSTTIEAEEKLGIAGLSYSAVREAAAALADQGAAVREAKGKAAATVKSGASSTVPRLVNRMHV